MIKPEELRIGNLVNYKGKPVRIISIDKIAFTISGLKNSITHKKDIKPIPLTEDKLKECGFKERALRVFNINLNGSYFLILKLTSSNEGILGLKDARGFEIWLGFQVDYIHQLQNLYYCLCGKELFK